MIPIKDFNPTSRLAVLTLGLIALNLVVFLFQLTKPNPELFNTERQFAESQQGFHCEYGAVPSHILDGPASPAELAPKDDAEEICQEINQKHNRYLGLLTSLFLHGGWLHLLGNMLFLWVFGNNIEDALGFVRFIPFYLVCGVAAALAQAFSDPDSSIPLIGASGAISGVLGAYLVLHPRSLVLTLILPFFLIPMRAWVTLGLYFVLQFLYLGQEATSGGGGVAYWAHIGGFVAGVVLIKPLMIGRPPPLEGRPPVRAEPRWDS